jgi:hypothetical protein
MLETNTKRRSRVAVWLHHQPRCVLQLAKLRGCRVGYRLSNGGRLGKFHRRCLEALVMEVGGLFRLRIHDQLPTPQR